MTDEQKEIIRLNRELGECQGLIQGVLFWDIPLELREKIETFLDNKGLKTKDIGVRLKDKK